MPALACSTHPRTTWRWLRSAAQPWRNAGGEGRMEDGGWRMEDGGWHRPPSSDSLCYNILLFLGYIGVCSITAMTDDNAASFRDTLTGAYTRALLSEQLHSEIERTRRYGAP